jgi:hypothetical protein
MGMVEPAGPIGSKKPVSLHQERWLSGIAPEAKYQIQIDGNHGGIQSVKEHHG